MISCKMLIQILEKWAMTNLTLDWDNPGLAVGDPSKDISKVLLTLTVTQETVDFASKNNFDMIISHHPLFFKPFKSLRTDTPIGRLVSTAVKNDIVIYSAHTNMDIAYGGINDILADALGLEQVEILKQTYEEKLKKIVVFVPKGYEDTVRDAMCDAGAGHIGNYSHCTFNINGTGTFKPLSGTHPFIGEEGKLEKVDEVRIETIIPESLQTRVLDSMLKVHPYEEVAFDIYPVENQGKIYGIGRIGYINKPIPLKEFCEVVKQKLNTPYIRAVGDLNKEIRKVAICGGAGADLLQTAALNGADVMVTGDLKYHEAVDAGEIGIAVIDAGHFPTENILLLALKNYLDNEIKQQNKEVDLHIFEDKDPFIII